VSLGGLLLCVVREVALREFVCWESLFRSRIMVRRHKPMMFWGITWNSHENLETLCKELNTIKFFLFIL
jgi:hypothetical protein